LCKIYYGAHKAYYKKAEKYINNALKAVITRFSYTLSCPVPYLGTC